MRTKSDRADRIIVGSKEGQGSLTGQDAMKAQDEMLKGLGMSMGGMTMDDDEDLGDDEYSAIELQMYQQMVDDGAAPDCDGLEGSELVECVDEALDAEE